MCVADVVWLHWPFRGLQDCRSTHAMVLERLQTVLVECMRRAQPPDLQHGRQEQEGEEEDELVFDAGEEEAPMWLTPHILLTFSYTK